MYLSNIKSLSFLEKELPGHWQITMPGKYAPLKILESADPLVANDISTYKREICRQSASFAKKVYTVDLDSSVAKSHGSKFSNIEYLVGN